MRPETAQKAGHLPLHLSGILTPYILHGFSRMLPLILLIACQDAWAGNPLDDFEAAKRTAALGKKDVLLSFSGYRWWCPTIGFGTQTDDPWITKHFVILEVEIPRSAEGSGAERTPEEQGLVELRKRFHQEIEEPSPAILLLDANGRPYAEVDSNEQPPEIYLPDLKEGVRVRMKRDAAFEQARQAKGLKKARLLNDGLRAICNDDHYLSETLVDGYYHDVFAEIIRNDPKDVLGRGKELKEKKQEEKEDLANREIEAHIKSLATELNRLLEGPAPLATYFSAVDKFLEVHPEFPKGWPQQSALMGKVEAAIILRDYAAALKALDEVVSVVPDAEVCKKLDSTLRPELAKALKLSAAGTDTAVTAYAIRLNFSVAVDADGSQTAAELKRWSADWDMLLMEDVMSRMLGKIDTLLRLRDYEEALKTLDSFVQYGHSTGQVMRRDRELRPIILRGLNKKSANAVSPSGTKPDEHSNGSTR